VVAGVRRRGGRLAIASRRLRILTLTDVLKTGGGAERLAAQITVRLDEQRFERFLCATRPTEGALVDEVVESGTSYLPLERKSRVDLLAWRPLFRLLRRERIDVLHAHKFTSNVWGTVIGRLARVPVVIAHEHTWSFEGEPLRRFLDRNLIGRFSDAFVAVSRDDERKILEIERVQPRVVRFVPNGITPLPRPSGRDVRAELGLAAVTPIVLSVGVLRAQKAHGVLIRAAEAVAREAPEARFLIAGTGPEGERLRRLVGELGLEQSVLLLGHRRDVPDLLAAADVAVSSSDFEGSPLAVMEYMAAGKAIVATRVGGVPDLIEDGVHGLLVERRDAAALAGAILRFLGDAELRGRVGLQARERQRREFDIGVTVQAVEALYEELFARTARARAEGWSPVN
jgi:glycosyltransferase involved in cell wall biosynthesis